LYYKDFSKIMLVRPPYAEQVEICTIIDEIDKTIEIHKLQKRKFENLKECLMKKCFNF